MLGGQLKAGCEKRISARVLFVLDPADAERSEHALLEIAEDVSPIQFAPQEFTENLEMTRSIDEGGAGGSDSGHGQGHRIAIGDSITVETGGALHSVGQIQELADRYLRFSRVAFPFCDGIRDAIIQLEQPLARGDKSGYSPKAFRSAEDWPGAISLSTVRVMFENGSAVLGNEQGGAVSCFGILCGARAGRGLKRN